MDGLFAATPPLEALRLLLSWAATDGSIHPGGARQSQLRKSLLIADVLRAFFEASAKRDLCVELPEEALAAGETPQDIVGKLKASLYGTRDASTSWQEEVAKCMVKWGFEICKYNPCLFHHLGRKMLCLVHGDDFVCVADASDLMWLKGQARSKI